MSGEDDMPNASLFTHGYALLIGVGDDLPVTVKDATGLRDILGNPRRCAYPPGQVKLLTEGRAMRQDILGGLDWLADRAREDSDSTVVVYFSGHGGHIPGYHLVPYAYDASALADTAVSGAEFTGKLDAIRSRKLLVLLDCCHAGGMADVKAPGFVKSPVPPELDAVLTAGSGRVVIASSRKDQVSYPGTPYSVFTQALREALAGYGAAERDGYAYIADMALYVGRMVANRTNNRQNPILKLAAADNFAVAYYAGGEKSVQPLPGAQTYPSPIAVVDAELVEDYHGVLRQYKRNLLAIEERRALFIDQAAVPLDLERAKEGILQKIQEIEATIENLAKSAGWTPPPVASTGTTTEDVMHHLDEMQLDLGEKMEGLRRGQIALYHRVSVSNQAKLDAIEAEVRRGRIEQGEMRISLDAIRRVLRHVQETGLPVVDGEIRQSLADIHKAVNSDLGLRQQLELAIPVIPFLLEYKIGLEAGVDLGAIWKDLVERVRELGVM
jgi:hypothetical protein